MSKDGKEAASFWQPVHSWRAASAGDDAAKPGFWKLVVLFSVIAIVFQLGAHFTHYIDYIGPDPDDSMRLVEVRDFLNGQNWFDLRQYRLGLDGGTLMHWSRLIDLPIAALIALFSLFLPLQAAEAAAATTWPLLLIVPLLASIALAAFRIGGRQAVMIALGLAAIYLFAIVRFRPGGLDHHNVQLILAVFIAAMLIDPLARMSNFAAAAVAGAFALAIGVETTPLVAVTAIMVAALWAYYGERYRRAAIGFGLAFALASAMLFFGTTPPRLYSMVTCDTLSLGFFSLAVAGGLGLALAAFSLGRSSMAVRLMSLVVVGGAVFAIALLVAPECLGNPLNQLDPLLKTMWLGGIGEAQSISSELRTSPEAAGGFYAVGLIAICVCGLRIMRRQQVLAYVILFVLIAVSWMLTVFQVRGAIFSNFLAFIPLSALIADLRSLYHSQKNDRRAAAAFVVAVLVSIPSAWILTGILALNAGHAVAGIRSNDEAADQDKDACVTEESVKPLASEPLGRILSTSNPGSLLLRFTPHSVLTANYHRNQAGMVAALRMGMASPAAAFDMIKHDDIDYVLLCTDDPQIGTMKSKYPNGLFARLAAGDIPEFLEPIDHADPARMKLFRVLK